MLLATTFSPPTLAGTTDRDDMTAYLPWRAPRSFLCARVSRFQSGHARRKTNDLYKKLSQNTLIGEVKFLLPGEKAKLRGMFSTAVEMLSNGIFYRTASPSPQPSPTGEGVLG